MASLESGNHRSENRVRLNISIVEDDRLTRENLVKVISRSSRFNCVGAYSSAEEALREVPRNLPDVILVDIQLPGLSGIECTSALKAAHPDLNVLILTTYDDSELIFNALRAGANGYLLKRSRPAELLEAIREVQAGGAPMSTSIARLVVDHFHQIRKPASEVETLTSRERGVLEELAKGYLYKEVADRLGISLSTVNSHVEAIYRKLHVQTRTEAILKLRSR
jgi:DNA-binding NarL/FixJ family response regulator